MQPTTILVVDDHELFRDSWGMILGNYEGFNVVGTARNGEDAIRQSSLLHPEIILMDINMQPVNGFEATRSIRRVSPGSKIIGVTMHAIPGYARKMLQLGASGYVTKNSSREELILAIEQVHAGKKYICDEVKNQLFDSGMEGTKKVSDINTLTKREFEITNLLKEGLSSKEIAVSLNISMKTVEVHRYNILKKLHLKNVVGLVNFLNANPS